MYLGHLGIGLWAKGQRPSAPLWLLLAASFGPDWIETAFMAVGAKDTPLLSHGLPGALLGAAGFTFAARLVAPDDKKLPALVTGVFASHIALDFLTGVKPTWPGGPRLGLHWYGIPLLDFAAEATVLILGWLWYRRSLTPPAARAPVAYLLIAALVLGQALFDWKFVAPGP